MSDVLIRKTGQVGRITLNRPDALNAITPAMLAEIDAALIGWAGDASVAMLVIDGAGDRAFCAGGDSAHLHAAAPRHPPERHGTYRGSGGRGPGDGDQGAVRL